MDFAMAAGRSYEFLPHERPTFPGSPANSEHADRRRLYFAIELALAQARSDALIARVQLYETIGGGWDPQSVGPCDRDPHYTPDRQFPPGGTGRTRRR